jgi:serine/threonine protein kinase
MRGHFVAYRTRFIVLDLCDGADLRQLLRRSGPLGEEIARGILGQIAAGLQHAHRHGILHLDLKPANVLVDRAGQVAITDFGLGRLIESDGCDKEVVGTPLYMPPEQFAMTDVGPHCDWYSLGCMAYELLTGERLFGAEDSRNLLRQKSRIPSESWPAVSASEDYRQSIRTALQPLVDHREIDLDEVATWARPVPELVVGFEDEGCVDRD